MNDLKNILHRLAFTYGGAYTEGVVENNLKTEITFTATLQTPRTVFKYTSIPKAEEPFDIFKERVRYELLWSILQKGVEFVNEQSDIFRLFNPDQNIL
jgi:hypothetical protein